MGTPTTPGIFSCLACHDAKRKCDKRHPCGRCSRHKLECVMQSRARGRPARPRGENSPPPKPRPRPSSSEWSSLLIDSTHPCPGGRGLRPRNQKRSAEADAEDTHSASASASSASASKPSALSMPPPPPAHDRRTGVGPGSRGPSSSSSSSPAPRPRVPSALSDGERAAAVERWGGVEACRHAASAMGKALLGLRGAAQLDSAKAARLATTLLSDEELSGRELAMAVRIARMPSPKEALSLPRGHYGASWGAGYKHGATPALQGQAWLAELQAEPGAHIIRLTLPLLSTYHNDPSSEVCECNSLMAKAFVSADELRWLSKGLESGDTSTYARQAWPMFLALARVVDTESIVPLYEALLLALLGRGTIEGHSIVKLLHRPDRSLVRRCSCMVRVQWLDAAGCVDVPGGLASVVMSFGPLDLRPEPVARPRPCAPPLTRDEGTRRALLQHRQPTPEPPLQPQQPQHQRPQHNPQQNHVDVCRQLQALPARLPTPYGAQPRGPSRPPF